jgi:hypothetical protein
MVVSARVPVPAHTPVAGAPLEPPSDVVEPLLEVVVVTPELLVVAVPPLEEVVDWLPLELVFPPPDEDDEDELPPPVLPLDELEVELGKFPLPEPPDPEHPTPAPRQIARSEPVTPKVKYLIFLLPVSRGAAGKSPRTRLLGNRADEEELCRSTHASQKESWSNSVFAHC